MIRTKAVLSALGLLLLAFVSAAPVPKAPPEPEPHYYFPTVVGDTWVFDKKGSPKESVTAVEKTDGAVLVTVTIDSDAVVGKPGGPPLRKNPQTYRVSEDGVVLLVPVNGGPSTEPVRLFKLPPAPGEGYVGMYRLGRATTYGPEDVAVKAGTFRAVRVVTEGFDGKGAVNERRTEWYAPRVGCVKKIIEVLMKRMEAEMVTFTPGSGTPLTPGK
jgi:hypothetical protein